MIDWIKRALLYALLGLVGLVAATYLVDYGVLRYRVATQKDPFGEVTVKPYYAIHLKTGKIEYDFQPPQQQSCANSLYPQLGLQPCWYLRRHPEQRIDI